MTEAERLRNYVGRIVVVDTDSDLLFVGTLSSADEWFYELTDADVHDTQSTTTTRDLYIINARKLGVKKNRDRVLIRRDRVVGLSALGDVTKF